MWINLDLEILLGFRCYNKLGVQSRMECQGAHSGGRSTLCVKYHLNLFKINIILIVQGYEKSLYQWTFCLLKICPSFVGLFENKSERYEENFDPFFIIAAVKVALTLEFAISNWNLQGTLLTIYVIFSYGQSLLFILE